MAVKFRLPGHDEMKRRLLGVDFSDHVVKGFYPLILKQAGRDHAPESFAEAYVEAVREYADAAGMAQDALFLRAGEYANVLIEDGEIVEGVRVAISRAWTTP